MLQVAENTKVFLKNSNANRPKDGCGFRAALSQQRFRVVTTTNNNITQKIEALSSTSHKTV